MVTCPWCGTSYAVFQPNCSQCGGPIHPPEVMEAAGEAPIAPPAAPRPISDSYAFKLMVSDGWSIASAVFVLLGGIFAVVGFGLTLGIITAIIGLPFFLLGLIFLAAGVGGLVWRYQGCQKQVQILKWGEAALGSVTDLQENGAVTVNGRHPWSIAYQYQANGQHYDGRVATLNWPTSRLQPGRQVYVLYMRDTPALSSLYPHP